MHLPPAGGERAALLHAPPRAPRRHRIRRATARARRRTSRRSATRSDRALRERPARAARAVVIGSLGNLVEWYDFYTYAAVALYFAKSFFPEGTALAQQLNAALVFALGFIARPVGGWLFGRMADRVGRRAALTTSVLLMCFGSLLIGLTPTYATIGGAAPVVLVVARLLQGLSLGGEYGASATYLAEVAPPHRRGLASSFQPVTIIGGQLLALAVLIVLQRALLTPRQLSSWGWRVPFLLGALFAVAAAGMRSGLHETKPLEGAGAEPNAKESTLRALARHPREVAIVVGLSIGGTAAFYTCTTGYMQKFLRLSTGLTDEQTTWVTASSLAFAMVLQPLYGALSDRIGRKWLLIGFGAAGAAAFVPLLIALETTRDPIVALLLLCGAWLIVSGYTSVNAVVKAELFPAAIRATGVGLPFAVTVSLFGGTAEPLALALKQAGHERVFYYYVAACIATSLVVYAAMRDTRAHSAMQARHVRHRADRERGSLEWGGARTPSRQCRPNECAADASSSVSRTRLTAGRAAQGTCAKQRTPFKRRRNT